MPLLSFSFPLHFLFFIFSFSFISVSSSSPHSFHDDRQSLLAFKNKISSDPHASMANWSLALPFCNWPGVTCSRRHIDRVVSLDLPNMELQGTISPHLGNLSFLHTLDLSNNALHGYIPRQLGCLFRLKKLWLHHIQLEGNIPSDLGNCTNLVFLALSYNSLNGSIPQELGYLTHLQLLHLGANILTGSIPEELGLLINLQSLDLGENSLHGHIPSYLSNCTNLAYLALSYNNLTGSIPHELGSLTHLQQLYLGANILTDFGIARLIGESSTNSHASSLALRGSIGYIAPEYGLSGTVSTQGDVYSYGILLLEMLTRKQPTSHMFVGDLNLHNWVNFAYPNNVNEVIESSLFSEVCGDEINENKVYKCLLDLLHVGLLCSKHSPEERPTMKVVVRMLESIREDLVANGVASRRLRRSISKLLINTNAAKNDVSESNDQSSCTF